MSSSSKAYGDIEGSRPIELPVFVTPTELVFAANKRRSLLTVLNPYNNEAQFRIMTTSADRFDFSITKGIIKPNRRIDITIRLLSQKIEDLPEPTEELQIIDYFRITLQVGPLKGNKPIKVHWCLNAELLDTDADVHLMGGEEKLPKLKIKTTKTPSTSPTLQLNSSSTALPAGQRSFSNQRPSIVRPGRQAAQVDHGSNVNLICTLCAIACVITLFLPLSIDSELCKKVKSLQDQVSTQSAVSLLSQLTAVFSVSYEMKLGCSFALGLFTYRLISTLPD